MNNSRPDHGAVSIDPGRLYSEDWVASGLGVSSQVLRKARKSGALRFLRVGGHALYFGDWVLSWLRGLEERRPPGRPRRKVT